MKPAATGLIATLVLAALLATGPARAEETGQSLPATAMEPGERVAIEEIVREYLIAHPEVVIEAIEAWRERQRVTEEERARGALVASANELYADRDSPVAGNPDGDVTIVEFFDYRCTYCKRSLDGLMEAVEDDGNVRLIFKEFPILGPESRFAARAALASREQGLYFEFHRTLMAMTVAVTEETVLRVAESVGLDIARLRQDMEDPAIEEALARNFALADALGVNGTPAFVIGQELAPGAVGAEVLQQMIARARDASG